MHHASDVFKIGEEHQAQLEITDSLLSEFETLSGDHNPMHVDSAYAQSFGFPRHIAFGNILGLIISQLVGVKLPVENVIIISQKVKYILPFFQGDWVFLKGIVTDVSDSVSVITLRLSFKNQNSAIIATGECIIKML